MQRHLLTTALLATCLLSACGSHKPQDERASALPQPTSRPADEAIAAAEPTEASSASALAYAPLDNADLQARSAASDVSPTPPSPPEQRTASRTSNGIAPTGDTRDRAAPVQMDIAPRAMISAAPAVDGFAQQASPSANTEHYATHVDNPVQRTSEQPLSTFSIDVDTGSYTNVRRMLAQGIRPPADAVRAEEMINYFHYDHPAPIALETPFRVTTELAPAPWDARRDVLMIGIKGYDVPKANLPAANLVFLLDTSGSMNSPDKLPLLKQAFGQLVRQLRPQDHVSIVVYAGSAGLVLPPTGGDRQGEILAALDRLQAGGSTNGGDGIRLAYAMARQGFVEGGINRVLLATDGDFNVGTVDQGALETLVGDQRKSGIALSTLGFGTGNYDDAMAERLADIGDGNHAYIDSTAEARKVLVDEIGSTLLTIAKDVKIQVEFNPAVVAEYRLIGYENRALRSEDFGNDRVDAGDIGAGHEVTALYEITRVGAPAAQLPLLRYGLQRLLSPDSGAGEVADLRLRYKRPGEDASRLIDAPIQLSSRRERASDTLRFASTVAAYADALRGGTHLGQWTWKDIAANARALGGNGQSPQRAEFSALVESARAITGNDAPRVGVIAE